MRSLKEWQDQFASAATAKFPNNTNWSEKDRVLSILRQLADISGALQKEEGILPSSNHAHEDPDHRIAALIADVLILVDERGYNLDEELEKVLTWYQSS